MTRPNSDRRMSLYPHRFYDQPPCFYKVCCPLEHIGRLFGVPSYRLPLACSSYPFKGALLVQKNDLWPQRWHLWQRPRNVGAC